ncbi:FMN reductase [Streptomyces sp. NPDC001970]
MRRSVVVVSAGLRQPSSTRLLAERLAQATDRQLREHGEDVDIEFVELRDHGHALVNHMFAGYASEELQHVFDTVARADAMIAVTPTFAASYNGLFKMFADALDDTALADKPALIAATGGTGRHSLVLEHALRPLFTHLHAVVVPTGVFAAPEDWGGLDTTAVPLDRRIERAAAELVREIEHRDPPVVLSAYETTTPFEQLLADD